MFLERIETEGLAHWSYYLEDGGEAVVLDPRRDAGTYVDLARSRGADIIDVVETHRNEDYVVGSVELAERTGARIWHAEPELDYEYGTAVEDTQHIEFGSSVLHAVHTPGHTRGHMCYVLHGEDREPLMLFSGDLLLPGTVGRTDLGGPQHAEDSARAAYHSLHERIFRLPDHVIVWPAHGPGSACGHTIADRPHTTIGIERTLNALLSLDENAFVEQVTRRSQSLGVPPYFSKMERMNLAGGRFDERGLLPPLELERVDELTRDGAIVLDTRAVECYAAAHVRGALAVSSAMLGSWAGWFLPDDASVVLVSDRPEHDMTQLARMGFDDVRGYLGGGMAAWEMAGRQVARTHTLDTPGVCRRLDENAVLRVLDVRTAEEVEALAITDAHHIPLNELPGRLGELTPQEPIVVFCGSGRRSMIAASILERATREPEVVLGGTAGWSSSRCPLEGIHSA